MNPLLTPENRKFITHLISKKTLFAFDYDGTLSKITPQPQAAFLSAKTSYLLEKLYHRAPIAILSGRSVLDLKSRLPFHPNYLIGNHGVEGLSYQASFLHHAQQTCSNWIQNLLSSTIWEPGFELEDKTYSLAIHYRRAAHIKRAKEKLFQLAHTLSPAPRVIPGKFVINLLPPGAPHKGLALEELISQCGADYAIYIGDDDTDEDVFSFPDPRIFSVRVGYKKASKAQFYIPCQSKMNEYLKLLIDLIDQGSNSDSSRGLTPRPALDKMGP